MEVCDAVGCARDGRRAEKKIERPLSSVGVVAGRSSAIFSSSRRVAQNKAKPMRGKFVGIVSCIFQM